MADQYYSYLQPQGPVEVSLVEELIRSDWCRTQRSVRAETEILARAMYESQTLEERLRRLSGSDERQISSAFDAFGSQAALQHFQRYATMHDNKYYRALHELQRVQAARAGQKVAAPVAVDVAISNPGSTKEEN